MDDDLQLLLAAVRCSDDEAAARILAEKPGLPSASLLAASAAGAPVEVERALRQAPGAANGRDPVSEWTPLLYASAAAGSTPAVEQRVRRCVELLLDAGADANATAPAPQEAHEGRRATCLYLALVSDHLSVAELLLARGAHPDAEAVDFALNYGKWDALERLMAAGAEVSAPHPRSGETPLYHLVDFTEWTCWQGAPDWIRESPARISAGLERLLAHGADPNLPSAPLGETPLHRLAGRAAPAALVNRLLDAGAAIDRPRNDGRTAFALAVRTGSDAVAALLAKRGAKTTLAPVDEMLGACMRGDEAAARRWLAFHPALLTELTAEDRGLLAHAALGDRLQAVRVMAALGFDLDHERTPGGTALHAVAWYGQLEMVRLLLELGARTDLRDSQHQGTPLQWAEHGVGHDRRPPEDLAAVIALLTTA